MSPFLRALLPWYRQHGRDLPWRKTQDPYQIFMSELMLQQTQVDRVIPLYERWLKQFPTWKKLAEAETSALIHGWAGLGYNRRALFARESAKQVVADRVPKTEDGWRTLKGVGPYMAAALTEFVNHKRALVIDTNIRRVIGRVFLKLPYPRPIDDASILKVLEKETPLRGSQHSDMPQALMDLASGICSIRRPKCEICPLRTPCKARPGFEKGIYDDTKPRKKVTERIRDNKKYPDRIYRGRILAWVRENGATDMRHLGAKIDPEFSLNDQDWVEAMIERMVKDGLLKKDGRKIELG